MKTLYDQLAEHPETFDVDLKACQIIKDLIAIKRKNITGEYDRGIHDGLLLARHALGHSTEESYNGGIVGSGEQKT